MSTGSSRQQLGACPLRLDDDERAILRMLEGTLMVSEWTDKVDVVSFRSNKLQKVVNLLGDMLAILSGMLVVAKGKRGQLGLGSKHERMSRVELLHRL